MINDVYKGQEELVNNYLSQALVGQAAITFVASDNRFLPPSVTLTPPGALRSQASESLFSARRKASMWNGDHLPSLLNRTSVIRLMQTRVKKGPDSGSRPVADRSSAAKHQGGSPAMLADNRPEARQLQMLQMMADNSPHAI